MHVLAMMTAREGTEGWRRVTGPGGYEAWQVEAHDAERPVRVVARMGLGQAGAAAYWRAYAAYRRRPTRMAPPLPRAYPWVSLTVWRAEQVAVAWAQAVSAEAFSADMDRLDVRMGPGRLRRAEDGCLELAIAGEGVDATLTLRPAHPRPPVETILIRSAVGVPRHGWVVGPPGVVEGRIAGVDGAEAFKGAGWNDYRWGTEPLAEPLRWWMRGSLPDEQGRLCLGARRDGEMVARAVVTGPEGHLSVAEPPVVVEHASGQAWPARVRIEGLAELSRGRVLDRSDRALWLGYEAVTPHGQGMAVCEWTCLE